MINLPVWDDASLSIVGSFMDKKKFGKVYRLPCCSPVLLYNNAVTKSVMLWVTTQGLNLERLDCGFYYWSQCEILHFTKWRVAPGQTLDSFVSWQKVTRWVFWWLINHFKSEDDRCFPAVRSGNKRPSKRQVDNENLISSPWCDLYLYVVQNEAQYRFAFLSPVLIRLLYLDVRPFFKVQLHQLHCYNSEFMK